MTDLFCDFYLSYFRSDSAFRGSMSKLRNTASYEIEFYKTSDGYSVIDGVKYNHRVGNVLFVKPNQARRSCNYFECYALHFMCSDLLFGRKYLDSLPTCIHMPECESLFHELVYTRMTDEKAQNLHMASTLLKIISKIHEAYPQSNQTKPAETDKVKSINEIADFIKNNYNTEFDISSLYKDIYISRSAFFRLFKEITGHTPGDYINTVRIENAKIMLDTGELKISEISQDCGFCSQQYFNYIFRKKTGMTPKQYRCRMR